MCLADAQPKKVFATFRVLLAATGAPRSTISLTSSMRLRRVISWIERGPRGHDLPSKDAADLGGRPPFRDMLLDEGVDEIVHAVGDEPLPGLALFGRPGLGPRFGPPAPVAPCRARRVA